MSKLFHSRKDSKSILIFIIAISFIAIFETICYAAFQQNLAINDITSSVRVQADIRITSLAYADTNPFIHNASTSYADYNKNNISSSINLPYADSSVTYKVKIKNIGNVEMGIYSLTGLPDNLDYEVLDYELGKEKLCETKNKEEQCKLGIEDTINIKIKYKDGMYNSSNTTYDFTLDFDFEQFHSVTNTNNIASHISNVPSEVMNKSTLLFNFDNAVNLEIYVSGEKVNYNYESGTVTVNNIAGPVEIKGEEGESLTLVDGQKMQTYFNAVRWLQGSYAKTRIVFTTKDRLPSTAISSSGGTGPYYACADEGKEDSIIIYVNNETIYVAAEGNRIKFGENVSSMFSGNNIKKTLLEIVIDDGMTLDGSNAKVFDWMFNGAEVLPDSQINNFLQAFEGANPTSLNGAFMNLKQVETLDFSPFVFKNNVQYSTVLFNATFSGDTKLKTIYVKSTYELPTSAGTQNSTFSQNLSLVGGAGFTYDSSKVSSQYARINTPTTPGYFTAK